MPRELEEESISEFDQILLAIIYGVELCPKDYETNEYIIDENRRIKLDIEGIKKASQKQLSDHLNQISSMLEKLLVIKMVDLKGDIFTLTESGKKIGRKIRSKWASLVYDAILLRCADSSAYAQFCEKVYGKNLLQFNVVNMKQLEMLLERLQLKPKENVLDLGCGLGKITEHISMKTNVKIAGIDYSVKAIEWARNNIPISSKLTFEVMDINEMDFPDNSFDAIVAFDVLYWIADIEPVMGKLHSILKPNGRVGLFYVLSRREYEDVINVSATENRFTKILDENHFSYEYVDISQQTVEIWKRKIIVGEELREKFEREGNQDIIDDRIKDGKNVIDNFKKGLQKKYLYTIRRD